ncbi:DUF2797 domain-containing protein [Streptomyces orinoci]|uniref:DUF2797 domain-containing protein n=1 Tax=Streptomyces orinoci TaxID=67339 RepID=A0ABV3K032_STRON|nr:DUF2797 domain-containing protein [Streptomyces orinoci]
MTRHDWQCAGVRWLLEGPALVWLGPDGGERLSPLPAGRPVGFTTVGRRHCTGVRRGGRHTPCPVKAEVPVTAVSAQCADCARLDRSRSVAADTMADDPRPYDVYLAWFGPGLVKVGITAAEREGARLLEQAALSYALLGRGPLMAARRAEAVLGAALDVPDRFPYAAKRAARHPLPGRRLRTEQLAALHQRACALPQLPDSLAVRPFHAVHHDSAFHLEGLSSGGALVTLDAGQTVAGRVAAVCGPDLHLHTADGRLLLIDLRLLAGWTLTAAAPDAPTTATVRAPEQAGPEPLF